MASYQNNGVVLKTRILPVVARDLGRFANRQSLETWELPRDRSNLKPLEDSAKNLRESSIPVGFPTETVYGLGADATRSDAVKGIYKAKGRPSDNPLIIHICDLTMLRNLLTPIDELNGNNGTIDPIPAIYKPLVERFWPGPLTILLPNPKASKLAPEVTAGLPTFGVRMPNSPLALSLIYLAGIPIAAPSANASTKPSPTTAEHVKHDLDGRIELILDGGACQVGVESTVVDGLCDPPVVLRPGGVSIDQIRECEGWEAVVKGYKDQSEIGTNAPRAPGMKYKHYSPKAKVVLYEPLSICSAGTGIPTKEISKIVQAKQKKLEHLGLESLQRLPKIGVVSTRHWTEWAGFPHARWGADKDGISLEVLGAKSVQFLDSFSINEGQLCLMTENSPSVPQEHIADLVKINLGEETRDIAHGLFSALRELDQRGMDVIYVEGIVDEGDIAAAVMNRLRKAATIIEK